MDGPPEGEVCSICHSEFTVPCQANCSHWFCGDCILQAWHYGSALQPCRCPLCRRPINLLIPTEASLGRRHTPEVGRVLQQLEGYNHAFGGGSSGIIQKLRDLPFLLGRLMRDLRDPQRTLPLFIRFRMALSAIYFLSPVDIIPEGVVGFIGLLDDALILLICAIHVANMYRTVLVSRHGG
ncbi:E3 ubiquitin-protein ligase RNF170-like protein [Drosera capensis]